MRSRIKLDQFQPQAEIKAIKFLIDVKSRQMGAEESERMG